MLVISLPQLVQKSGICSSIKSGIALNSKVLPSWPICPPDVLIDFSLKLLDILTIFEEGGFELFELFLTVFHTLISSYNDKFSSFSKTISVIAASNFWVKLEIEDNISLFVIKQIKIKIINITNYKTITYIHYFVDKWD